MYFLIFFSHDSDLENLLKLLFVIVKVVFVDFFCLQNIVFSLIFIYSKEKKNFFYNFRVLSNNLCNFLWYF